MQDEILFLDWYEYRLFASVSTCHVLCSNPVRLLQCLSTEYKSHVINLVDYFKFSISFFSFSSVSFIKDPPSMANRSYPSTNT
jgi:hypothetical protein